MRELKNQLSINDEWCPASDGGTFQVLNSTTEKVITNAASGTNDDAMSSSEVKQDAFSLWSSNSPCGSQRTCN